MIETDKPAFARLMVGLGEYYGKDQSKQVLSIYWKALEQYDLDAVDAACRAHISNPDSGQWFPKIADLVRLIDGGTNDRALLAWTKVDQAVRRIGTFQSVCFDDGLIHVALQDMGGWQAFGNKTEDEWPFIAKEFQQRYRALAARPVQPPHVPMLIGGADAHNARLGYAPCAPVMVGDPERARLVYEGGSNVRSIAFTGMWQAAAKLGKLPAAEERAA